MRVAICDDDAKMREYYADLIKVIAEQQGMDIEVDTVEKGERLLYAINGRDDLYDIIFLDIFMPGKNGIDLGTQIGQSDFIGSIVYLTRSKEHMLSAFDVGASNYVVKGEEFDGDRFEKVFLKTVKQVEKRKRKHLLLNGVSEHRNVAIDSILYFEVNKHVCNVHYGRGEVFEFVSTLNRIEKKLLGFGFVRVHKSFLVNCAQVKSFTYKEIHMKDGTWIPLGRQRSADFRRAMNALSIDALDENADEKENVE